MFSGLNPLITAVSALLPGLVIGYLIRHLVASRKVNLAESKAEAVIADSRSKSQDILLEAKNNAFKILEEAKKEEKERNSQLSRIENLLTRKESELEQKAKELSSEKETLKLKTVELVALKSELEQSREKQLKELERVSGLDREKAKIELVAKTEEEYKDDLYKRMRKLENENREELEKKAREILTTAIQRYAASHIADAMTTVVSLPSDEVKGKIKGKEGKKIKAIERLTGVKIINPLTSSEGRLTTVVM